MASPFQIKATLVGWEQFASREVRLSPNTCEAYGYTLRDFAEWAEGRTLDDLARVKTIRAYLMDWQQRFMDRTGRAPAETSYNRAVAALRSWFHYLSMEDIL